MKKQYMEYDLDLEIFKKVYHFNEITSTNSELFNRLKDSENHPDVVVAEIQTGGRGRRNNEWYSPLGGVWLSVTIPDVISGENICILNIACGISCIKGCKSLIKSYGLDCTDLFLRWPNDIILNGKKLGGLLIEVKTEGKRRKSIILGIGINVNQDSFPDDLKECAISLSSRYGRRFSRKRLLVSVLKEIEKMVLGIREKGTEVYIEHWKEFSQELGRNIEITIGENNKKCGKVIGIGTNGELVIVEEEGEVIRICDGYDLKIVN